jgi:hydroxypyruvate reductase
MSALMRLGASITDLNTVRIALSGVKGGELATRTLAPIVTLAISDVIGDEITTIGSGPTVGPWISASIHPVDHAARRASQREAARGVLERYALEIPRELDLPIAPTAPVLRDDFARVVVPMRRLASSVRQALAARLGDMSVTDWDRPLAGDVRAVAARMIPRWRGCVVWWGEPTIVVPPVHGAGGRMQQLALELAKHFRTLAWSALAIGSDGMDGPAPSGRPAPAGAYVDGTTWDAIIAKGIDPQAALDRCDAGTALAAVGALVITGPTGVNHADLVVIG